MIRKLQAYVNDDGIKIEHIEAASEADKVEFSYFGVAQMVTNFGQSEVRFVIPAANLEEAFSKYEDELKKFSDEMKKQITQRQQAAAAAQQSAAPASDEQTELKLVAGAD
jgi:hypothetical protein